MGYKPRQKVPYPFRDTARLKEKTDLATSTTCDQQAAEAQ